MAVLASRDQGGRALIVCLIWIGVCLEQVASALLVPVLGSEHERRPASFVSRVNCSPRLEQCANDLLKAKTGFALACGSGRAGRVLALQLEWGD